jgi:hypothetical protein
MYLPLVSSEAIEENIQISTRKEKYSSNVSTSQLKIVNIACQNECKQSGTSL